MDAAQRKAPQRLQGSQSLAAPRAAWIALALLLPAFAAYLPALSAGFIWDDDDYVTRNPTLETAGGLADIWTRLGATRQYYPLVYTSFWVERRLYGLHPLGYHAINILLHAANAFLLWRVLRGLAVPGALFAAFLFALHPVHVESVAWITERKNVLSGLFYLAALTAYLRFAGLAAPVSPEPPRPAPPHARVPSCLRAYALSLACFILALLSKTAACTLPVALLIILWWKRPRLALRDVLPLAPFLILAFAAGLVTMYVEKHHVGTAVVDWGLTPLDRICLAGRAVCFYAGKLLWPHPIIFIYPRWAISAAEARAWLYPIAVIAALFGLWFARGRIGKGPLAAGLIYLVSLGPTLGFIDVYVMRFSFVADHFQYIASFALIALVAAVLARLGRGLAPAAGAGLAILVVLTVLTFRQACHYKDLESIWLDTIAKNDGAWIAHNNLGTVYQKRGQLDLAASRFRKCLELDPDYASAHFNLGTVLYNQGMLDEAAKHLASAVRLDPANAKARVNYGLALLNTGHPADALPHLQEAIRLRPGYALAYKNMGDALQSLGRSAEAAPYYREAVRLNPADEESRKRLMTIEANRPRP